MNVFLFETKLQIKSAVIWTSSIVMVLFILMLGMYPAFEASLDAVTAIISGFPPAFASAFSINITAMFSMGGFYSFAFVYISLMGAIMAVSMGLSAFSRERRFKCVDFLLTKPISRGRIFFSKLLSSLAIIAITNIIYMIACMVIFTKSDVNTSRVLLMTGSLFLTQLVFLVVGIFFAVFAKRVRSVTGISTAFGFGAFILSAMVDIFKEEAIRFIAPLKYFDPTALFTKGVFEPQYTITGIAVIIVTLCFAFVHFCKSDAHAV